MAHHDQTPQPQESRQVGRPHAPIHIQRAAATMAAAGKLTPEARQALDLATQHYHRSAQYNAAYWLKEQNIKMSQRIKKLKK